MKTQLRKLFVIPMLAATLMTAVMPAAKADIFEEASTSFCYVNVITPGGVTTAIGMVTDCNPSFNWWCKPKRCTALSTPIQ